MVRQYDSGFKKRENRKAKAAKDGKQKDSFLKFLKPSQPKNINSASTSAVPNEDQSDLCHKSDSNETVDGYIITNSSDEDEDAGTGTEPF